MAHRKRRRNPADPEHVYNEAIGMVAEEFEETQKRVMKKLHKIFGKDVGLAQDAMLQGFDMFKEEWQL